jgi:hypothetical protein
VEKKKPLNINMGIQINIIIIEKSFQFLKKIKNYKNSHFGVLYLKELRSLSMEYLHSHFHCSVIHNSYKMELT